MSELLSSLEVPTAPNSSGRKSNYTQIYPKDEKGDEAKDYARVWNVYLDERENYDAAMIQSFRNIVDNLLTFATLFAGIVATFVVTTASELAPDDTPIIAALLVENNQLLRAAGNSTSLNAVPPASLNLGGPTLIDLWVNGLFFTSLALSLLTALATVLVKQWLQDVVVEAVTGLLHDWTALLQDLVFEKPQVSELDFETVVGNVLMHDLFPAAVDYSLKKLSTRKFESTMEHDNVGQTSYGQFLQALLATTSSQPSLMKGLSIGRAEHPWRKKIQDKLDIAYRAVALKGDHILSKKLLGWGACILPTSTTSEMLFLQDVASRGDAQIITDILDRKPEYLNQIDCHGLSALHFAASHGRLDAVTVLVERGASLDLLSNSPHDPLKAIDLAIRNDHPEVVAYLLDHHADRPAYALHEAAKFQDSQMAKVLLDRGWVKLEKNDRGQTPVDVATALGNEETAKFLDEYEPSWLNATFPHQHNQNMSPFPSTH
ncbi:hypothetical protein C0989_011668 [Termitomyces sp. Mn162]|nr:hypothetical protein C0989_011668 [Termitomyces sp. Mn162]